MRASTGAALGAACLIVTVTHVAWAQPAQAEAEEGRDERWVDSPYAPHNAVGPSIRAGTEVGYVYGKRLDVLALGGNIAVGHRWNRLTVEAEYGYLGFQELGPSSLALGHAHRVAVTGRFEPIRFGSDVVGANSMIALYVEASIGRRFETWYEPETNQPNRIVPDDGNYSEGSVGFGLLIDHRLERPSTLSRVGWLLGWRLVAAPDAPESYVVCRGVACARGEPMPMKRTYESALLFGSSLAFTW